MSNRMRQTLFASLLGSACAVPAAADVPQVAADIGPVHGLVARVMDGLGSPDLIVRQGASPHGYSLSPSEAEALQDADAVFWVGPELEPWLGEAIETLASDAEAVALLESPGTETLPFRQGATFEAHDHGDHAHGDGGEAHAHAGDAEHDHAHDDGHAHDGEHDHDGHEHADEHHAHEEGDAATGHAHEGEAHSHEDHGEHAGGHHHSHEGKDPHAWLAPENAKAWLGVIADELGKLDPENAEAYAANAQAGQAEIQAATSEVRNMLSTVQDMQFVVFHDAYQYFETTFGMTAAGAISVGDASDPSPSRVEDVRETVRKLDVSCVFSEPQFNQGLVETVIEGTEAHSGTIDPLGSDIELGPDFYPTFLTSVAGNVLACVE